MKSELELCIIMILSIAFRPIPSVTFALVSTAPYANQNIKYFRDILEYFENNYMGLTDVDGTRKTPMFPIYKLDENYQRIICQQVQNGQSANSQPRTYHLVNEGLRVMLRNHDPASMMAFSRLTAFKVTHQF
ncbi:hypothetical protein RF11_08574 [Thelohanellus kitauei]|uniref:Uncharacterized protein n=1 Tax=Thelohanellus kitauei TaxID=669202 RepID=A0A0C2IXT4_THEKT|nr:hypothetical protein RF11_08574 [Thelohanellus kitauei]